MSRACVLLAQGFEEIEAVTIVDVLRRGGVDTRVLGVGACRVPGAHGLTIETDAELTATDETAWDLVALPGGLPGASNLRDDAAVQALLRRQQRRGGKLAAICAGPIALAAAGALRGRTATCYPGFGEQLGGATLSDEPVVVDGPIITSRGPGTALAFALRLVAELQGEAVRSSLAERMVTRT